MKNIVSSNSKENLVCLTNQNIQEILAEAEASFQKLDGFFVRLEENPRSVLNRTLEVAVYFAIACVKNPKAANTLPGYGEIKGKLNASPYLVPMKYAARGTESKKLRSKLTKWAAIANAVADRGIERSSFLEHVKRHGGFDEWYRAIPKEGGKGGRPRAATENETNEPVNASPAVPNPYVSPTVALKAKRGRELVAVVFDITQSANFTVEELRKRFESWHELVDVVPVANISPEADSENEAGKMAA